MLQPGFRLSVGGTIGHRVDSLQNSLGILIAIARLVAGILMTTNAALAESKIADHPLFSRYPGAKLESHKHSEIDELTLVIGESGGKPVEKMFRGDIAGYQYELRPLTSTLELLANYETAAQQAGFQLLFRCTRSACKAIGKAVNRNGFAGLGIGKVSFYPQIGHDGSYYVGERADPNGTVIVAFALHANAGSSTITQFVIQQRQAAADKIKTTAGALEVAIASRGRFEAYDILFGTDAVELMPESQAAIQAIAEYLQKHQADKFYIVGHTDSAASLSHNQTLSLVRANAVVLALTSRHPIAINRLSAQAVGPLAPVASNATDEGRSRNRRVEIVLQ